MIDEIVEKYLDEAYSFGDGKEYYKHKKTPDSKSKPKSFTLSKGMTWRDMKMYSGKYNYDGFKNGNHIFKHEDGRGVPAIFDDEELQQFMKSREVKS